MSDTVFYAPAPGFEDFMWWSKSRAKSEVGHQLFIVRGNSRFSYDYVGPSQPGGDRLTRSLRGVVDDFGDFIVTFDPLTAFDFLLDVGPRQRASVLEKAS